MTNKTNQNQVWNINNIIFHVFVDFILPHRMLHFMSKQLYILEQRKQDANQLRHLPGVVDTAGNTKAEIIWQQKLH